MSSDKAAAAVHHAASAEAAMVALGTMASGLSENEAELRLVEIESNCA